jgi:hypothetical protein
VVVVEILTGGTPKADDSMGDVVARSGCRVASEERLADEDCFVGAIERRMNIKQPCRRLLRKGISVRGHVYNLGRYPRLDSLVHGELS